MSDDRPARVFIGQAKEHQGKFGKYITLRLGLATVFLEPSKEPGKFNCYMKENPPRDAPVLSQKGFSDRMADDGAEWETPF